MMEESGHVDLKEDNLLTDPLRDAPVIATAPTIMPRKTKVLVVGASGYVGHFLCANLRERNYAVGCLRSIHVLDKSCITRIVFGARHSG